MKQKPYSRRKRTTTKSVLRLPERLPVSPSISPSDSPENKLGSVRAATVECSGVLPRGLRRVLWSTAEACQVWNRAFEKIRGARGDRSPMKNADEPISFDHFCNPRDYREVAKFVAERLPLWAAVAGGTPSFSASRMVLRLTSRSRLARDWSG